MSRPLTLNDLPEDLARFAETQIASGRFASVTDVLRAGAAALEQQEETNALRLAALKHAAAEGFAELDQGKGIALPNDAALDAFLDDADARASLGNR